jgi:hypothetical protein
VDKVAAPEIPESFFELRQLFAEAWVERWGIPNPFISALVSPLRLIGVELSDFSFNKEATNVAENYLNISIRHLNAAVRIGLDMVTFIATNPYWQVAPQLSSVFDQVSEEIRQILGTLPKSQEAVLAFHVTPGSADFRKMTAALVNKDIVGESVFCGVSLHKADGALTSTSLFGMKVPHSCASNGDIQETPDSRK